MVGLTLLHPEWPKLHRVLAILSAKGLRSTISWAQHIKDGCQPSPLTAFEVIFPNRYPFTARFTQRDFSSLVRWDSNPLLLAI